MERQDWSRVLRKWMKYRSYTPFWMDLPGAINGFRVLTKDAQGKKEGNRWVEVYVFYRKDPAEIWELLQAHGIYPEGLRMDGMHEGTGKLWKGRASLRESGDRVYVIQQAGFLI